MIKQILLSSKTEEVAIHSLVNHFFGGDPPGACTNGEGDQITPLDSRWTRGHSSQHLTLVANRLGPAKLGPIQLLLQATLVNILREYSPMSSVE